MIAAVSVPDGIVAAAVGVLLSALIGWGSYITRRVTQDLALAAERLEQVARANSAVLDRLDAIARRVEQLERGREIMGHTWDPRHGAAG